MAPQPRASFWRHPGFRSSVISLAVLTLLALLVGFVWLPSVHGDFSRDGLWASICRAAGVPSAWYDPVAPRPASQSTDVVLDRTMTRVADAGSVGRGATLALNCTMCHGALGMSTSHAPNLAGQYPEVVIKQMRDYRDGKRTSTVMQALAGNLSDQNVRDLAAYYASLPKARTAPTTYDESLPALVRVGAPLRNIAPCISCHGGVDQKLGAPWIEGMPKEYLVAQLVAFRDGTRRNDSQAQMRSMARTMTDREVDEVATFYARKAAAAGIAGH
jgi:cytochrome c553